MTWEDIKGNITDICQIIVTGAFIIAVSVLILIHVFDISGNDIKGFFASSTNHEEGQDKKAIIKPKTVLPKKSGAAKDKKAITDEIHQYTEFVTVNHSQVNMTITTGIRYENSTTKNIDAQWCYAQKSKSDNDGFFVRLSLQVIDGGKATSFAPYSVQTLREFGLTQKQAQNLLSYCRFK